MAGSIDLVLGAEWSKTLTPREREVAFLVARGLSNKHVAQELRLSDGTVKVHVHNILRKLGAKNRYGLMAQSAAAVREWGAGVALPGGATVEAIRSAARSRPLD